MEDFLRSMDREVAGNPLHLWVACILLFLVGYGALRMAARWVRHQATAFAEGDRSPFAGLFASVLGRFSKLFLLASSLYAASLPLSLTPQADRILARFLVLSFLFQGGIWGNILLKFWLESVFSKGNQDEATRSTVGLISTLAKGAMYTLLLLLALNNLGVDITALVAGLGVGGIAVALAAQNILGDLFASLTIVLDRPFSVGDPIQVDADIGTVEHVGLKTTRIRALSGEQLVFPNASLLQSRIRNHKRLNERRVVAIFNVTYETPLERLKQIPNLLKEIVTAHSNTRFDRAHFKSLGASSLDFELVYWITSPEYIVFMDTQQSVNFEILSRFLELGIGFAYPTQTLYVQRQDTGAGT
jgi:small-conductance mechanosensitive channel